MTTRKTYDPATVHAEAYEAGQRAMEAIVPAPMMVRSGAKLYDVPGGPCGFGWVDHIHASSKLGRWLVEQGIGKSWGHGVEIHFTWEGGQSLQLKTAFALAYADVLNSYGIKCDAHSAID